MMARSQAPGRRFDAQLAVVAGPAGNDRGNGNPAKRAYWESADAIAAAKALVGEPGKRSGILIIRRSWVRSPPAPPRLTMAGSPLTWGNAEHPTARGRRACAVVRGSGWPCAAGCGKYAAKLVSVRHYVPPPAMARSEFRPSVTSTVTVRQASVIGRLAGLAMIEVRKLDSLPKPGYGTFWP
jgi:hypothetical protein